MRKPHPTSPMAASQLYFWKTPRASVRGRGATAGSDSAAGVEGAEISGPYSHLHFAKDGRPGPPSRRRPLSSTGAGGVEARRGALTALRLTPARVTQSTTPSKSKTESGEYFTSSSGASCVRPSSPLISSSSFASSPCCPPSLSEWRLSSSARGDREHCIRITTVQ